MSWTSLTGMAIVGFIVTDQFYTAVNIRMLFIAAIILGMVWPDLKRLLIRQYVRLMRGIRFIFTPSKYYNK
ncbi:MAG TPA: hypothetical protein VN379_19165 [Sporomusa sp.]|jgi:hypothetical protein|nr:hypothetical protein [Sporomusa sp.]MDF2875910.1 hypothetical protein [Sporomusa sp.]HWR08980.1 hypothetical protein [Sporomusa sp.]